MYTKIEAVALRTVRHNDRTSILTAWSPVLGRLSLIVPAGNGVESRRQRAVTMPLGLFEGVVKADRNGTLSRIRDLRPWGRQGRQPDVSSHPVRSAVAMFVAEVLCSVTREGDPDNALWALIVETTEYISSASARGLSNMPVMFLLRLASVLGIEPNLAEYVPGMGFDAIDGVFRHTAPIHKNWVPSERTRAVVVLARAAVGYRHLALPGLSRQTRQAVLDELTEYFTLHHFPLNRLRSLDILRALFA